MEKYQNKCDDDVLLCLDPYIFLVEICEELCEGEKVM